MDLKFKDNSKLRFDGYTQLEYIESTGTQYIDTGIVFSNGFRLVTDYIQPTNISGRVNDYAGAYDLDKQNIFRIYQDKWYICVGKNSNSYGSVTSNIRYSIDVSNINQKANLTVNGTVLANDVSISGYYPNATTWLFALHRIDGSTSYQNCSGKFGRIKLYGATNTLVRDFIPAKDNNNVVCLYDTISKTFFYNQGTGDFIGGPRISYTIPDNVLLKTTTLYHKNTPNVDGLQLLNEIFNYQRTHQDEVKGYYYSTTQLWQNIITKYSDIVQYYNMNHKLCGVICEADDPEQCTEDFLSVIDDIQQEFWDYPELIPIIAKNPEVIHNLVDTGYETVLTSTGDTSIKIIEIRFLLNQTANIDIYVPSLSNECFNIGIHGSDMDNEREFFYTGGSIYYDYRGRLSTPYNTLGRTRFEIGNKYVICNSKRLLGGPTVTNEISYKNFEIRLKDKLRLYSFKDYTPTEDLIWLVPIQNNGNPCMIDLLTGTKYFNQGTGSFTYSLEPKNA